MTLRRLCLLFLAWIVVLVSTNGLQSFGQAAGPQDIPLVKRTRISQAGTSYIQFIPDGRILFFKQNVQPNVRLFDPRTLEQTSQANVENKCRSNIPFRLPITPDGKFIFVLGEDGFVRKISLETGEEVAKMPGGGASAVLISEDNRVLVCASQDRHEFYSVDSGKLVGSLRLRTNGMSRLSPTGQYLLGNAAVHPINVWSAVNGRPVAGFGTDVEKAEGRKLRSPETGMSYDEQFLWGELSPEDGLSRNYHFWEARTGKLVGKIEFPADTSIGTFREHVSFTPDGRFVVLLGTYGQLLIYSFPDLELVGQSVVEKDHIFMELEISPAESLIAGRRTHRLTNAWHDIYVWDYSALVPKQPPPAAELPAADPAEAAGVPEGFRVWTSRDGKFQINAKLVSADGVSVKLETEAGKIIEVPLAKLSIEDRLFTRQQADPE